MVIPPQDNDPRRARALARYQVISAYLALDPPRGKRKPTREQLAAKVWTDEHGERFQVSAETIRVWVRRYYKGGLDALADKQRPRRGTVALSAEQVELVCDLKREVPQRSLDRIITIAEQMKLVEPGLLRRSTLHRVLQRAGISRRPPSDADRTDLDRFEADFAGELWQSDMLVGPWLPDPDRPGKMRRAYLYAFLDDHSRLLLYGRFSFKGDLPALELVLRRCLQRWGKCRKLYYDNGATYRAGHMKHIVAELGIHPIIYTTRYRPQGHGKIEALNRLIRSAFIAEARASRITTMDALNEAFLAWADVSYNRQVHSETGEVPLARWRADLDKVEYADEEKLREAFLWRERRTPDKAGVFSLFGTRYQVSSQLARRRVEIRYDPEATHELEIWHKDRFVERVRPFSVRRHRREKAATEADNPQQKAPKDTSAPPVADWLGHLVKVRRAEAFVETSPKELANQHAQARMAQNQAVIDVLIEHLDPAVIDVGACLDYLDRHGPFDPERAEKTLHRLLGQMPNDQHILLFLDAIRQDHQGEQP